MAGTSLLALLDDIATILDDVSVMTKVAAKKTAGVLGDDLALNAQQVSGVKADRELPVVWAVAKGSFVNKLILVPAALLISVFLPWLITPLLMVGGAYLCYEGCEKLLHKFLHGRDEKEAEHQQRLQALSDESVDLVAFEKSKIKGCLLYTSDAGRVLAGSGHREAGRCRPASDADARGQDRCRGPYCLRASHSDGGAVADEDPVRGWYRRHVPGGWRDSGARYSRLP